VVERLTADTYQGVPFRGPGGSDPALDKSGVSTPDAQRGLLSRFSSSEKERIATVQDADWNRKSNTHQRLEDGV